MLHIHDSQMRNGHLEKIASGLAHIVCYFRALFKNLKIHNPSSWLTDIDVKDFAIT